MGQLPQSRKGSPPQQTGKLRLLEEAASCPISYRDGPQAVELQIPCPPTLSPEPLPAPSEAGPVEAAGVPTLGSAPQGPAPSRPPSWPGRQPSPSLLYLYNLVILTACHTLCLFSVVPGTPPSQPRPHQCSLPASFLLASCDPASLWVLNPTPAPPSCLGPSGVFWHTSPLREDGASHPDPNVLIPLVFPEKQQGPGPTLGRRFSPGREVGAGVGTKERGSCSGQGT